MNAVQIGLVGVAGALLAIQFKNGKSEYGIYLSVAVSIFIFLNIVGRLEIILETLRAIGDKDGGNHLCSGIFLWNLQRCRLSDGGIPD